MLFKKEERPENETLIPNMFLTSKYAVIIYFDTHLAINMNKIVYMGNFR